MMETSSIAGVRTQYAVRRTDWAAHEARLSWSRLAIFAAIVATWAVFWSQPWIAVTITVFGVVAFFLAVRLHHRARDQREHAERLILIAEESGRRSGGTVTLIRSCERPADDAAIDALLPVIADDGP